jgi:hypothetical protein
VIFHVIHESASPFTGTLLLADLDDQITALNEAYDSASYDDYTFQIAAVLFHANTDLFDDVGPQAYDEDVEHLVIDAEHYVNVIIGDMPPGYYGWATWPNAAYVPDGQRNQILLDYTTLPDGPSGGGGSIDDGINLVHEMGHYLGFLEHVHDEADKCDDYDYPGVTNTPECDLDDTFGTCPEGPEPDEPYDSCVGGGADPIANYMHYTSDACRTEFTGTSTGQDARLDYWFEDKRLALDHSSDEITIPTGQTVTLDSTTVYLSSGYGIVVEGTLEAENTSFEARTGTWDGIEFASGSSGDFDTVFLDGAGITIYSSSPTLHEVDIDRSGSGTGIYVSGSGAQPDIQDCQIDALSGINFTLSASGNVGHTTIEASSALSASFYASPYVHAYPYHNGGSNEFIGSHSGNSAGYSATIYGGTSSYNGNNHYCGTLSWYDAYAYSSGSIQATGTYWPSNPPSVSGSVTYTYKGASSCSGISWKGGSDVAAAGGSESALSRALDDMLNASAERDMALFAQAESQLKSIRIQHTGLAVADAALVGLRQLERLRGGSGILGYFESLAAESGPDQATALGILVQEYQYYGDDSAARGAAATLAGLYDDWHGFYARLSLFEMDMADGKHQEASYRLAAIVPRDEFEIDQLAMAWARLTDESGIQPWTSPDARSERSADQSVGSPLESVEAHPNPFNPSTTFAFQLTNQADVEIRVIDLLGRQVASLANSRYATGRHTVEWDASGEASGSYFVIVRASGAMMVVPVVLLK